MKTVIFFVLVLSTVFSASASNYSSSGEAFFVGFLQALFFSAVIGGYKFLKKLFKNN